ncbi:MAG: bifunctional phosphopantothenoylcysteine decarboxylase/phosphopantothenate--cysteine ligase CoaBC [Actinomycetota bacterium]
MLTGRRVLLGVTGSIAAYKAASLARLLVEAGADVQVIMTSSAERFVAADTFAALTGNPVHTSLWDRPGEIVHVRLAHETDITVVAPATANVLAKLANGLADDLLTSTLLEVAGPLFLVPAMHTGMWQHPATRANVATLIERGARMVGPVVGALAAGDQGLGRMAEPEEVFSAIVTAQSGMTDLSGLRMVVTAGPTQEPIDPVRFIGNRSTGKMGVAIAAAASARGADVRLVLGPDTVTPPPGVKVERVSTAEEMRSAILEVLDDVDVVVMAAAVADFRPKAPAEGKLTKEAGVPDLHLEPTPDILRELGERKGRRILVGFAAETDDLEAAGRRKLESKHLDLIVVNEVGRDGTGFGADTNDAMLLSAAGNDEPLRTWTKAELATAICDRVAVLGARRAKEPDP